MGIVLGIALAAAFIVSMAGMLLIYPAMWRGFREQWQRFPPENRRRGLIGGALTLVWIVVAMVLSIVAPWGPNSFVWVVVVGGGGIMLLSLIGVFVQALRDTRRVRKGRPKAS